MRRKKIIKNLIFVILVLFPVVMFLIWVFTPKKPINILILDKTVLTKDANEHTSFNWILKHEKFVKPNGEFYSIEEDYLGFFPLEDKKYEIKDLQSYSERQIDSLADSIDMFYCTDSYGIYYKEWYTQREQTEHSPKIYGGLDKYELSLLQKMKQRNKLVVAEFNTFATPTSKRVRESFEDLFNIEWTGWTARYFHSLDTLVNPELPGWVTKLYKEQHNDQWPFTKSGIVFVHSDATLFILENETDLNREVPVIMTDRYGQTRYKVIDEIEYPFWIDFSKPTDTNSKVVSTFNIFPNERGDSILRHHNFPSQFPAVIERLNDCKFYYFGGDFADNPIRHRAVRMKGVTLLSRLFLKAEDVNNRLPFFYDYYLPIMRHILIEYYAEVKDRYP